MDNFFSDLDRQLRLVDSLSNYSFSIETYNENDTVVISSGKLTESNIELQAEDVVYLTEYGSIKFPGIHFMQHFLLQCENRMNLLFDEILYGIFERDYTEVMIEQKLKNFEIEMNFYIRSYLENFSGKNTLAKALNLENDTQFLIDPKFLVNHIRLKIYKNLIFLQ